ncbi:MAG: DUF5716 family protein [Roseburia sp.]|nr:DUF5716 family protein [Roseburia sp.]
MFKQFGNGKLVAGIDINDSFFQLSYCMTNSENVETVSSVAGAEVYSIPTVLCKRSGVNQWYYGNEAIRYAGENDNILIDNLLSLAISGETVRIEEEDFEPEALLALFLKRSMGALSKAVPDRLEALMITCEKLDYRVIEVLNQVVGRLDLKTDKVFYQSHMESFYAYMLRQPEDLWLAKTLLLDYRDNRIVVYQMECNRRTRPMVVFIGEEERAFPAYEPMPGEEELRAEKYARLDAALLELVQEALHNQVVSAVYLIGEDFREEWMKETLRFLCKGRRVFQGNNLYSKGACYGMLERIQESEAGKEHVFLGKDKLKANIGMNVLRRGEASYYALLDAGENWFEAEKTLELYIQKDSCLEFIITSLVGRGNAVARVTLEELAGEVSRLRLHLYLQDENSLMVEITDLGFGTFRASQGKVWKDKIAL